MKVGTFATAQEASDYLNQYVSLANRTTDVPYQVEFVSYEAKTKTLKLRPAADLEPGETYTMTVLAGFAAATGRSTTRDVSWIFSVAATDVEKVTLANPIDASELVSIPVLSWLASSVPGATYDLQVSDSAQFTHIIYDISGLTATSEDRLSSNLIQEDTTYYWRVRAKSGIITGVWSDVRSFKVKAAQSAPVPAGSIFDTFGIVSVYPPDGASNLADWPTQVRVTFTAPPSLDSVAANVAVTANNIDTGAVQTAPTLTPSVSGNTLTLLLSGEISANTRYTVSILDVLSSTGVQLSNPTSFSFTGPYTPLYSTASALRTTYGRFLLRYKDDEINYQIHRASIKCNRILDDAGSLPIANLLVAKDAITFDMVSYVEAFSAYCLIQSYLYEMLEQAGRTNQIDTLRASTEARLIADIDKVLKELEIETKRLEMALKGGAPSPVVGVRSSGWDPSTQYDDQSTTYLVRGKF